VGRRAVVVYLGAVVFRGSGRARGMGGDEGPGLWGGRVCSVLTRGLGRELCLYHLARVGLHVYAT
jgi:hypothetical protein